MNRAQTKQRWRWLTALCLGLLLSTACAPPPDARADFHDRFFVFGTIVELTLSNVPQARAATISQHLQRMLQTMHNRWHAWEPSLVTELNSRIQQRQATTIPPRLQRLITRSRTLSQQSGYLFNPAIGRLIRLWGFQRNDDRAWQPPNAAQIAQLVASHPTLDDVTISQNGTLHSSNPDVQLDFGGIAKGYGIDLAIRALQDMGVNNAVLNAGGDLKAIGRAQQRPWTIGIRHPNQQDILGVLATQGEESVFTSGDYERKFDYQGKSYHHIINPITGYPATRIVSATVMHASATVADAAATAFMINGTRDWRTLANNLGIQYLLLLDQNGHVTMTTAMAARVRLDDRFKKNATIETLLKPRG